MSFHHPLQNTAGHSQFKGEEITDTNYEYRLVSWAFKSYLADCESYFLYNPKDCYHVDKPQLTTSFLEQTQPKHYFVNLFLECLLY
jgi:hypothetical protein